ncbi:GcrA cell cycle regulator [Stappia taiwanensis]|uniref:GcrA cell cycle regulator n=1 Tax=Stappia taiwanensis TaxID=992267 RepID=A0A838XLJ6_9HYPH|nr:GcrA family cell cycle regulator [Stappia taiwanensis]MBA4612189.1 GcrA cell cycle regulator [Stappia taiwanensis]GGE92902.1 GcrA cell cycle regulator [Stappia taiwanensis]
MSWTSERVDLLKKLWSDGLSASQIAAELGGVTRNAVIGKVHRLGLSGRAKAPSSAQKSRKVAKSAPTQDNTAVEEAPSAPTPSAPQSIGATALKAEAAPVAAPEPEAQPVAELVPIAKRATILTLTERTCKWPIGDPTKEDFYFCGHPSNPGVPYCAYHCRVAYQPASDRRRDKSAANG